MNASRARKLRIAFVFASLLLVILGARLLVRPDSPKPVVPNAQVQSAGTFALAIGNANSALLNYGKTMSKAVVSQSFAVARHTVQFEYFDIFGSGAKISEREFAAKYPEIYAAQTNFQFELETKELIRQEMVAPPTYSFDHIGNILLDKVN